MARQQITTGTHRAETAGLAMAAHAAGGEQDPPRARPRRSAAALDQDINPLQRLIQQRLREQAWSYGDVARRGGLPRSTVYTLAQPLVDQVLKRVEVLRYGRGRAERLVSRRIPLVPRRARRHRQPSRLRPKGSVATRCPCMIPESKGTVRS